jgi:hypothetical protein
VRSITSRAAAALVTGALIVVGCGDTDGMSPGSEPDPAAADEPDTDDDTADDPEPDTEPESADEPDEADEAEPVPDESDADEGADDGWQYLEEFDDPIVTEESGVRLSLTGLGINDVTTGDIDADVREFLDDGTQTLVVLEMTASNDSGGSIDFYPN